MRRGTGTRRRRDAASHALLFAPLGVTTRKSNRYSERREEKLPFLTNESLHSVAVDANLC
ncbi:hypothetical protein HSB1_26860 [Halogranum salarium B-1]|uniref:Uncharacterized protein n=1 Tax=Halogranum salarium B-1 TaxID=1210908 RepID=J2ZF11_9EURY|nr:hypothetical protein HSB1_26860 [Halogranum salarium B-1]